MKKTYSGLVCLALSISGILGCQAYRERTTIAKNNSVLAKGSAEEDNSPYETTNMLVWEVTQGVKLDARLETLKKDCLDKPCQLPYARLIIKNLASHKVIYQRDTSDTPGYLCLHDTDALIVHWHGGSADRIEILSINESEGHQVLYESYRLDASVIMLTDDEEPSVLITTAEGGGMPLYTTRYKLQDGRYQPVGRVPFTKLNTEIRRLLGD